MSLVRSLLHAVRDSILTPVWGLVGIIYWLTIALASIFTGGFVAKHSNPVFGIFAALVVYFFVGHLWRILFGLFDKEEDLHISGTRLISFKDATVRARKLMRRPNANPPIPWGGLALSNALAPAGFLAVGSPGSGKTVSIDLLLKSVLGGAQSTAPAVIFDPKTDVFSRLKNMGVPESRVCLLSPFDTRGYSWNLAADIERAEAFPEIATTLFPKEASQEPFFENATRDLLTGVLLSFHQEWPMKTRTWSLRDVLVALSHRPWLVRVLAWHEEANGRRIEQYFAEPRVANNIMSTVSTKIAPYQVVAAYWHQAEKEGKALSLEAWKRTSNILVLPHSHRGTEALRAINQVMFRRLAQVMLDLPMSSERRIWVVLDELSKAGKLPKLDELIVEGRDRGICVVAGFQDIDGLREVYGPNLTGEVANQLGHKAFFGIRGKPTADWAESVFGQSEVWQRAESRGGSSGSSSSSSTWSVNWHPVVKPIVFASELQAIERPEVTGKIGGFYFTSGIGPYSHALRLSDIGRQLRRVTVEDAKENLHERPAEQGFLKPWTNEELEELGLPPIDLGGSFDQRKPESPDDQPLDYR